MKIQEDDNKTLEGEEIDDLSYPCEVCDCNPCYCGELLKLKEKDKQCK